MPADYQSTARALSVPVSPQIGPESPLFSGVRPPWTQSDSTGRRSSLPLSTHEGASLRDQVSNLVQTVRRRTAQRWDKLSIWQRILAVFSVVLTIGLSVGLMVLTGKIFIWIRPMADKWEHETLPYIVVWLCIIVVSFPPLIGWTTLGTISGLIFGFWKGYVTSFFIQLATMNCLSK
jgi:hypothetical protein